MYQTNEPSRDDFAKDTVAHIDIEILSNAASEAEAEAAAANNLEICYFLHFVRNCQDATEDICQL